MAYTGITVQNVLDDALSKLTQAPGTSTQLYATPELLVYAEQAFQFVFQKTIWKSYKSFVRMTLDGTTGHLNAQIDMNTGASINTTGNIQAPSGNYVTKYTNILMCWPENSNRPIREIPPRVNPQTLTGAAPLYRDSDPTNPNSPIIFYPITSAGNVVIQIRDEPPTPFQTTDTLLLDKELLSLGTCYFYLIGDGDNPGAADAFQKLFTLRLQEMIAAENDEPLQLDPRFTAEQDQWWELG